VGGGLNIPGGGDHFASTKPDGLTWVGLTFEDVGLDESTTAAARDEIIAAVVKNIPSLAEGQVVLQTACLWGQYSLGGQGEGVVALVEATGLAGE